MFSIIIPLYNKGSRICTAVESVLSQDCDRKFEILIIDDGSTDNSSLFATQYCADERVLYYYKQNGGVSSARNYGVEKSKGRWITFLDADDEMLPGTLRHIEKIIKKYPDTNFIASRQDSEYASKGLFNRLIYRIKADDKTNVPFFLYWSRVLFASPGTMFINRNIVDSGLRWNEQLAYYEDMEYVLNAFTRGNIVFTGYNTMRYFQETTGLSLSEHPIEKEMAYYIPTMQTYSFWHKALLYENLQLAKLWWQGHPVETSFYDEVERKCFDWRFRVLHWIRQKMIRRKLI